MGRASNSRLPVERPPGPLDMAGLTAGSGHSPFTARRVRSAGRHPGRGRCVYRHGAGLRVFDVTSGQDRVLPSPAPVRFRSSPPAFRRQGLVFQGMPALRPAVSGSCSRAGAGGLASCRRVDLAIPESSRAKDAVLGKDGAWVYAICDAAGDRAFRPAGLPACTSGRDPANGPDDLAKRSVAGPDPDGASPSAGHRGGVRWMPTGAASTNWSGRRTTRRPIPTWSDTARSRRW